MYYFFIIFLNFRRGKECETENNEKVDLITAQKAVEIARKEMKVKKNAKIKLLQQKCRRLEKKVESLEEVLVNARERNILSQAAVDQLYAVR